MGRKILIMSMALAALIGSSYGQQPNRADYGALFPKPPRGWKASDVTVEEKESLSPLSLFGANRLILTRTYYSQRDGGQVTIELDTENLEKGVYLEAVKTGNRDLIESLEKDGIKKIKYRSYHGVKFVKNKKSIQTIALAITAGGILEIRADRFGRNKDIVMKFLKMTDLQKIYEFLQQ